MKNTTILIRRRLTNDDGYRQIAIGHLTDLNDVFVDVEEKL